MTGVLIVLSLLSGWAFATAEINSASPVVTVKTYENDTVLLPCHVEDLGLRLRVRWWRSGKLLADSEDPSSAATNPRVKMWDNRNLELVQVTPEDSGEYVCEATLPNPWINVTQIHEIQVMYPASVKPIPESGQLEVALNEKAVMSCMSEGVPKPVLAWSFQGKELPVLASGQNLTIDVTNRSLAGTYTCLASNGIGEPAQADIVLKIKHKPEVTVASPWQHSAPGIRSQLECAVTAWPEAQVDWYFEGAPLDYKTRRTFRYKLDDPPNGQGISAERHILVIRSVRVQDLGRWTCRAVNELGAAEAVLELSGVPKPPHLKKEPRGSSGHVAHFIWDVDSYSPIVEYQLWFKQPDSQEAWRRLFIPSDDEGPLHTQSFNLTGLQANAEYEALVLARNRFGWSGPSKTIRFATSLAAETDGYENGGAGHDKIPPAVQVTSDSHRSALSTNSSGPARLRLGVDFLVFLLLLLLPSTFLASG